MKRALGTALMLLTSAAWSDTTYKWTFIVLDGQTKAEVPGVIIDFTLTDPRTRQQQSLNCITSERGRCEVSGTVSGGGLFTKGAVNGTFSISKEGYQKEFKSSGKLGSFNTEVLTVFVDKKKSTPFSVVGTDGSPVGGAQVRFLLAGTPSQISECITNAEGVCAIEFPGFTVAEGSVSKPGYYAEQVKSAGGQTILTPDVQAALQAAAAEAKISCTARDECDRAYALAQVYLARSATSKIQFSNDTITETFNPAGAGDIGGRVTRIPSNGGRWDVILEAYCGSSKDSLDKQTSRRCDARLVGVYSAYAGFVKSKLQ